MPPKNINLGPVTVYFQTPEGLQPFGGLIESAEITEEAPELDLLGNEPRLIVPQQCEFTAELNLSPSGVEFFNNLAKAVNTAWSLIRRAVTLYQAYPNGRVKHLALYAKKKRTRKKNMRRIAREVLKEIKKRD